MKENQFVFFSTFPRLDEETHSTGREILRWQSQQAAGAVVYPHHDGPAPNPTTKDLLFKKKKKTKFIFIHTTELFNQAKPFLYSLHLPIFSQFYFKRNTPPTPLLYIYIFFYYSFPKLNYRFRFAAGRASPSLIHFIFFFLHSVHQTINVCPD